MSKKEMKTKETFDMEKYRRCAATVEACKGCCHEFEFVGTVVNPANSEDVVEIKTQKCKVYANPSKHWPRPNVKYVEKTFNVRLFNAQGRPTGTNEEVLPVVDHRCAMATHIKRATIVDTITKVRAGQGRTKSGGNR